MHIKNTFYLLLPAIAILSACNKSQDVDNNICGKWKCEIIGPNYTGFEYLDITPDNNITIVDSLCYSIADAHLKASVEATLLKNGNWNIINDSLYITTTNPGVNIIEDSFSIQPLIEGTNNESLDELKSIIRSDFFDLIDNDLKTTFVSNNPDQQINLGKISMPDSCTIILSNSSVHLVLNKIPEM